ncbi:MAG: PQQ-like beta-propeller repeat protein [Rhodospirillaceae bacterium]|nr:PQQ-like beta-propeller repeat protein [Rhodospirillaceae bacterium]
MTSLRRIVLFPVLLALVAGLSGCDTITDVFSTSEKKEKLPGTRISVLALERELRPNIESVDTRIILPRPEDTSTWPGAGGLSHHAMHHVMIGEAPRQAWSSSAGEGSSLRNRVFAEPVVADGRIYTMDADGEVSAFDTKNGKRLWRVETAPEVDEDNAFLGGALCIEDKRLFATSGAAQVLALDAVTGKEIWRVPVETPVRAAPTVNAGRVFVVTVDNQVVALSAETGRKLWAFAGSPAPTILLGGTAPAVDGGVVVAALSSGELVALRSDNGTVLWNETVVAVRRTEAAASLPDIAARAVIDKGRVYAVGQSGILVAIDLRTGRRLWDVPVAGIFEPWIAGDFLFAITIDSEAVGIDARSGRILWVTQLPRYKDEEEKEGRIVWAGPALASDRLILVGSNGEALSLSPYSGAVLGKIELRAGATLSPVFANSTMYLLDDDGDLTAYR